ncbi:bifunctional riboflavin kinase/FAD synthetase [Rhodophyticola sp. CCM32]|uniref:bifunctional riboflavin kinase/FAD synthetase n=1 Tax=Rhodophyticola sp. CCM32 TaxID=2916397 RepID=UPI00107EF434|nr:bifunctional riboflavin kinase/FAD synthetase [Rhodophyticola sp. CCM32]QBX99691.1 bifunctional riboflavin kinase/FAD synthetase [Rhodophyticola sp. CCM32]
MRTVRDYQYVSADDRGASVAIGNFDGVHLGHQHVMDLARIPAAPLGILTFEPHPREFFAPDAASFRLMNAEARENRLQKLGVELLYELSFNKALASLEAETFAREVLAEGLGLTHVVVGADFCFGKGRAGTAHALQEFGARYGFEVTIAPIMQGNLGAVSSTNIRNALSDGRPRDAAAMLGHWHRIEGPVLHGEKRGRELGYPTANMSLAGLHVPKLGVYAVIIDVLDGAHQGSYHGVASLGVRPMFGGEEPNLESYLFDFKGDLYGADLSVGLIEFLRPEENFDGIDRLITQMDADSAQARSLLAKL